MNNHITKSIRSTASGIDDIIERYLHVRSQVNNNSAYTRDEVERRLKLMLELDTLDWVLRILDIQSFELKDYNRVTLQ